MDWPVGRQGQILAALYIVAFVVGVVGLIWALIARATIAFVMFVVAQVVLWLLALRMRNRAGYASAQESRSGAFRLSGYQRAWHRLALGLEVPAALRRLGGSQV